MKKIVCVGNMNNYPLILSEALRRRGYELDLFLIRSDRLHRPEAIDDKYAEELPHWIIDCPVNFTDAIDKSDLFTQIAENIRAGGYDFALLNDFGMSLSRDIALPHLAITTGSDLTQYSDYALIDQMSHSWDPSFKQSTAGQSAAKKIADFVSDQRIGISTALAVAFTVEKLVPAGDRILAELDVGPSRRFCAFITDLLRIDKAPRRTDGRLRVLFGARLTWRQTPSASQSSQDLKGADILIDGFADFINQGHDGELVLVRKGADIGEAERLIDRRGIHDRVIWLPELTLMEFREEIANADIVCDQLANSFPGMVTLDAYATGRPVLANFRHNIFIDHFGFAWPGLQASTREDVCRQLTYAARDRHALARLGTESRAVAEKYFSAEHGAALVSSKIESFFGQC